MPPIRIRLDWKRGALGVAFAAGSSVCAAQLVVPNQPPGLRFDAGVTARETYTDNILLAPVGNQKSGFATEVIPNLKLTENSNLLRASVVYAPDFLLYSGGYGHQTRENLNAIGTGQLVPNFLFLDAIGTVTQQRGSVLGPTSGDSPAINSNRLETRTYGIDPYIRGETSGGGNYYLRNDNVWTRTSNAELPSSELRDYLAHFETAPQRTFGVAFDAAYNNIAFSGEPSLQTEYGMLRPRYHPDPDVVLYGTGGYEHNNITQGPRSNAIYGAELDWVPSRRTSATARWEHHFFGSSYLFSGQHRAGSAVFTLAATRGLGTFSQQTTQPPAGNTAALLDDALDTTVTDPAQRADMVNDTMRNGGLPPAAVPSQLYYAQGLLVSERQDGSLAWITRATTTTLSVFRASTRNLIDSGAVNLPSAFVVGDRVKTVGYGLTFLWRVTLALNLTATGYHSVSESDEPLTQKSTQSTARLTATQILNPKTNLTYGVRYTRFNTSSSNFTDYIERAVFVGVDRKLW